MELSDLQNLTPMEIKSLLKAKDLSGRQIAKDLKVDHTVVNSVINNKYNGAESTKKKVLLKIAFILTEKKDLNNIIYADAPLYVKLLGIAIKHKSFNDDETMNLIETKKILESFINNQ